MTTAFDVDAPGTGRLTYEPDPSRGWWRAVQMALWFLVLVLAAGARSPFGRRRATTLHDETLIDLGDAPPLATGVAGEALAPTAWEDEWDDDWFVTDDAPGDAPIVDASADEPLTDDAMPAGGDDGAGGEGDLAAPTGRRVRPMRAPGQEPPTSTRRGFGSLPPSVDEPVTDDDEVDLAALVARADEELDGPDDSDGGS